MRRKTKEQRAEEAKAALRQRVADIAVGAAGYNFDSESEFATAEFLSRFLPALKAQFGTEEKDETGTRSNYSLFDSHHYLPQYDNVDSTTEFLFENDVRA